MTDPTVSIVLVHHPILDRDGEIVTTAITNLDVHDISRSARAYGCRHMFVVHPVRAQRELVGRIRDHWVHGSGKRRIPDRAAALELVKTVPSLDDVFTELGGRAMTEVWATAAQTKGVAETTFAEARTILPGSKHLLLVFGTGWGLPTSVLQSADRLLSPIVSGRGDGWNHLSVRAACAIVLDRVLGP
jgi:hypothetical protein